MMCDKCGRSMKFLASRSNGQREVWSCPAKGCGFQHELEMLAPQTQHVRGPGDRQVWTDKGRRIPVWHWDGERRAAA